ncbi:MAG: cytochrome c [Gammaproteobacteria bacterium]|nr:cytochrome c [Gammaproteobacteria bacterium]
MCDYKPSNFKSTIFAILVALISLAVSNSAYAHGGGPVYEKRHVYMNELGDIMKAFGKFVKRGEGDLADLVQKATRIIELAPELPSHFPPDTGLNHNKESQAKPIIWEKWDDFTSASERLVDLGTGLKAAFSSEDEAQISTAVKQMGEEGCRACHSKFRIKKN